MKILGLFRGFPGLGRVVSGVSLLETLRDIYGFKVKAISYLQGNEYLRNKGFDVEQEETPLDYCSIGILPTNHLAEHIRKTIKKFHPDIVLIDGEPLIIQSLRISYPNLKVVVLLNPSDVENENNDKEVMDFFNASYQQSDLAIVHGNREISTKRDYKKIISIPTILRPEITSVKRTPSKKVYCILGGGTVNVGHQFSESTMQIGALCIRAAKELVGYTIYIVCSSPNIYKSLHKLNSCENVTLIENIIDATIYYSDTALIVTRSGRNTLGEVSYLGVPTISFISGCEYRRFEQEANIESLDTNNVKCANINISTTDFVQLVKSMLDKCYSGSHKSGNELAIDSILSLSQSNSDIVFCKHDDWL